MDAITNTILEFLKTLDPSIQIQKEETNYLIFLEQERVKCCILQAPKNKNYIIFEYAIMMSTPQEHYSKIVKLLMTANETNMYGVLKFNYETGIIKYSVTFNRKCHYPQSVIHEILEAGFFMSFLYAMAVILAINTNMTPREILEYVYHPQNRQPPTKREYIPRIWFN